MNNEDLKIKSYSFRKLLNHIFRSDENVRIDQDDALLFSTIDKAEEFCHVQFTSLDGSVTFDYPLLWPIKNWKITYTKYILDKERSAQERKERLTYEFNTDLIARKLFAADNNIDFEFHRRLAYKYARNPKYHTFIEQKLNIKLEKI